MKKIFLILIAFLFFACDAALAEWTLSKKQSRPYEGHGRYRQFTAKGALVSEHVFITGTDHEVYLRYHDNGKIAEEIHYKKSPDEGLYARHRQGVSKQFYPDGQLKSEQNFSRDLPEGLSKKFYPDGTLKSIEHFNSGLPHGPSLTYHDNGHIKSMHNYAHGRLYGLVRTFCRTGHIKSERRYKNNRVVGVRKDFFPGGRIKAIAANNAQSDQYKIRSYYPSGVIFQEHLSRKGTGYDRDYHSNGHLRHLIVHRDDRFVSKRIFDKDGKLKVTVKIDSQKPSL